jgi:hypothetical protein
MREGWQREIRFTCKRLNAHCEEELQRVIARHRADGVSYFVNVAVGGDRDNEDYIEQQFSRYLVEKRVTPSLDSDDFLTLVRQRAQEMGTTLKAGVDF